MPKRKIKDVSTVFETLSGYIKRVERFADQFSSAKKVIISTNVKVPKLREDNGIRKTPLVWPLWDYKMFYFVEVPPGGKVEKHSHDESVFRMLISGSLTINGTLIDKPGTWYVVPAFTEYEISTETGYYALSAYTHICRTRRQQALRDKSKRSTPQA